MASKSEAALKLAIQMEEEGKTFYLQSAARVKSTLARKIFEELAVQEDHHIVMIKKIYGELKGDQPFKQWMSSAHGAGRLEKIFQESLQDKARASEDDLAALQFGLGIEEKSITYYEKLAAEAENPFEKRFYLALSYEERGHYLRITDAMEYLKDPVGWFYISERDMVDGG